MKFAAERVIDYACGSGVSVASLASKASPADLDISLTPNDMVSLLNMPLIEMEGVHVVTADVVSVGGLVFVGLRAAHKVRSQCQVEAAAEESPHKLNFHVPCSMFHARSAEKSISSSGVAPILALVSSGIKVSQRLPFIFVNTTAA